MAQEITAFQEFQGTIKKMEGDFKTVLPPHIKPEKFAQVAITAIQMKPGLLELNRSSLYTALTQCASDGLIPDGREAAIVPFKGSAKYMPMVQGITKKARNSGEITSIDALVVYTNDQYDSWVDEKGQHFMHKKAKGDRGTPVMTYAYAITKDGGFFFEEISEEQMLAIERCSKSTDSPWRGPFKDEMKRKSALRRLCKYRLPSSSDLEKTLSADDDIYDLNQGEHDGKEPEKTTSSKLNAAVTSAVTGTGKPGTAPNRSEAVDAEIKTPEKNDTNPVGKSKPGQPVVGSGKADREDGGKPGAASPTASGSGPDESGNQVAKAVLFEKILTKKDGERTRFGCKTSPANGGIFFGTFNGKVADVIQEAIKSRRVMNVTFTQTVNNDVVSREIVGIEEADLADLPPGEVDDIPC
jgi:recombination protein RecT